MFLKKFFLPDKNAESRYFEDPYNHNPKFNMQCYSHTNFYPFRIFPEKGVKEMDCSAITILYGGNGSGKSTVLNMIAETLKVSRISLFNRTPYTDDYVELCRYELADGIRTIPGDSKIIASDTVFDYLIDIRSINEQVDNQREKLFEEYSRLNKEPMKQLQSLDDLERFKLQLDSKRQTKSIFTTRRLPKEIDGKSNGESAFLYFTSQIDRHALYLLDEPENSLSAQLQIELAEFIENSSRFYDCQFVIATHSPLLLAMKGAKIYSLDDTPVSVKKWTDLKNVREYYNFFKSHEDEFTS
jgi:predicted ATPase